VAAIRSGVRRHLAATLVAALALMVPLATEATTPEPEPTSASRAAVGTKPVARQHRPNIVVIMADDMRRDDLRWMPKTRRLIGGLGATFENSFSPYPLCCPARASFLTGQYSHNHRVLATGPPFGFPSLADRDTLPVWLRRAGYQTLFLGKYLNGYGKLRTRGGRSSVRYVPPGWTDWRGSIDRGGLPPRHPKFGSTYYFFDTTLNVNGKLESHQGEYQTRMLGGQSVGMVRRYAELDRPFFLWVNYVAPHHGGPREADDPRPVRRNDGRWAEIQTTAVPPEVRGRFDRQIVRAPGIPGEPDIADKPSFMRQAPPINRREWMAIREAARQRAEALSVLDEQVARTIGALRRTGELRNTLVMFTSDNGYFQGEHRRRQGKILPYEPAIRIPLLVRGPGIPHGVVRGAPFMTIDFAPTILKAARVRGRPSIDGQSMLGVARRGGGHWRRGVLTETGPASTFPYVSHQPEAGQADQPYSVGVRTPGYLYVQHLSGEAELYDMRRDPRQLINVANRDAYAPVRERLAAVLGWLRHCDGQECRRPLPGS
jgi:N-acetylglucosamine-6-sulfatase